MGLLLIPVFFIIVQAMNNRFAGRYKWFDKALMNKIFWFHVFMSLVYFGYTMIERSDSRRYFEMTSEYYESWGQSYRTGTQFIHWVGYPFVNFLGFDYTMMMSLFAFFGFIGFFYFYCFFRENMVRPLKWKGFDLLTLLMLLPNMHFWSASFGKGALIFMGMGIAAFGMSRINARMILLAIGLLIVYHVRPHVFLFMIMGIAGGYFFGGGRKIPAWQKYGVVVAGVALGFLMFDKIAAIAGLDSDSIATGGFDQFAATRAKELGKSGSGVDTSQYPLPLKLITFWFRPLFVDAPGLLGLIVSVENTLYVMLTFEMFKKGFLKWFATSEAVVKASIIVFFTASVALSTTMGNLGIIIRQKSQVMYFYFFLIVAFMNHLEVTKLRKELLFKKQRALLMARRKAQAIGTVAN